MSQTISPNVRNQQSPVKRGLGLAGTVVSGVAALLLAFGAPAAQAASVGVAQGHVDIARVGVDAAANKLIIGMNHEYAGTYYNAAQVAASPTSEPYVDLVVTKREGTSWVIPETQAAPTDLFAGFAASGSEFPEGTGAGSRLVNGDHVAFTVASNAGNPGSVSLVFPASTGVTSNGNVHTATVANVSDPEAFHAHPKWTFSAAGTYYITISASNPEGKVGASTPLTYKIVAQ